MAWSDRPLFPLGLAARDLDQIVSDLWGGARPAPGVRALADVYLTEDPPTVTVQLDIAGVDPDAIDVELDGDQLVIRGERRRPEGGRLVYQHAEIEWGRFERRLRLGVGVDAEAVTARYERGMLTVALPLAPTRPPSRVAVTLRPPS